MLPYPTIYQTWQTDQTFSKGFFLWNSKISESLSIGTSKNEYYVDEMLHSGRSKYLRANLAYNASFLHWVTFETTNDFTLTESYTDGNPNGKIWHTFTNSTSLIIRPCKIISLSPSVSFYNNNYSSAHQNNVFLNCNAEYSTGKVIISLRCSNLLNNCVFRRFYDNGIISYSSEYRLRGRTLMLGIRIKIF